jgi:CubicO group peptidase (beta-lactamase class C family)
VPDALGRGGGGCGRRHDALGRRESERGMGMSRATASALGEEIREQVATFCEATGVPGYLAGVNHAGDQTVVTHGLANVTTGTPMREDTGFLFGSITKVLTTTLVLQQVERGAVDLGERVIRYLPEFRLATRGAAEEIRVRHLLTHTNGIDADLFFPVAKGPGALAAFVEGLGSHCGALFQPDEYVSYSNGGMVVAGRLLEMLTGTTYHDLLRRELFGPVGMADACSSAEEAILRSTAVGHFADPATKGVRRTDMFMLPETWAPAGSTPIGSIGDLLAFGRTHLGGGVSPSGRRVLSGESTARMQTVSRDMGTPNVSAIGLGWPMISFGRTTVLAHSGASAGGVAILAVFPEHDLVFAAFGNDMRALALHDRILLWLLRERLDVEVPDLVSEVTASGDLARYAGTYRSNQLRVDVRAVDGQLEETATYEPQDRDQERIFTHFCGGSLPMGARRLVPIGEGLFAPAGMPLQAFNGYARQLLVSYHGVRDGRAQYRCAGGRMTRREQ